MTEISNKLRQDILAVLQIDEAAALRINMVKKAHGKYMETRKAQHVAADKPGPAKGKKGKGGPKYMPPGRVTEQLTEFAEAKGGGEDGDPDKKRYPHGPVIDPTGNDNHPDFNTYTHNHGKHEGRFAKYNTLKNGKASPKFWVVSSLHPTPNPKTGERHRVLHMMTPDEGMARKAYEKLNAASSGALLHAPGTLKYKPHQVKDVKPVNEDVNEGWISKKVKSIKKYMTGQGKEQQERLASKLDVQLRAQPAKIAAADGLDNMIDAKDRHLDLRNRLKAVQDPEGKRKETEGVFGALGGQYLSGQRSTANVFRGTARSVRRFNKSMDGLQQALPKLDAAIDSMDKVIAKKRANLKAKKPKKP